MQEPQVTLDLALRHGLREEEYRSILDILQRAPTYTELGIYSVMWSEHCSYKNSIAELKTLPRSGERLLVSAGEENAGLVDIGGGLAVAFKIESHNHPSAVEPYQGAATGVGGIMRDIFTMGARPIAALNSLRFGSLAHPKTRYLLKGIVKGIGDYANSFGVPTVAGDLFFDESYGDNPIVNAMAVGIVEHAHLARAVAAGEGNLVMIVGSSTGRDGIHGATFASEEISEDSEARRPSVQVGDPFTEKLLLEATLEAIGAGYVVGIQDMGAAGIACSSSEMSAKGRCGMTIEIEAVPTREPGMTPYEIMLSESQERMLLVATPANEENLKRIFGRWDLKCEVIGRVTSDGIVRVVSHGKVVASIPAESLVLGGGAPVYHPRSAPPETTPGDLHHLDLSRIQEPADYNETLLELLASPNICSRRWVFTQYDSMVRTNTVLSVNADAAVVRIKGRKNGLALKTDCNPRYVFLNPYRGAQIAVAESARNVACVGATPLAITNCLNFGNPDKPEMFWQFKEAVRGIGDACRALGTPVTGGNVSFYNESADRTIYPTPIIGMLGELEDVSQAISASFKGEGDTILLLGQTRGHLGGSEYVAQCHGMVRGDAPELNLEAERRLLGALRTLAKRRLLRSAHDLSEGGLAVALAECSIFALEEGRNLGAIVRYYQDLRTDQVLFGEDQTRAVVSIRHESLPEARIVLEEHQVPWTRLGHVIPERLIITPWVDLPVGAMGEAYFQAIETNIAETAV